MKIINYIILLFLLHINVTYAQTYHISESKQTDFKAAYLNFPTIPIGILEAVSYTKTHCRHIKPTKEQKSCIGLPTYNGIMGLTDNTNGYFKNTLQLTSNLSGFKKQLIQNDIRTNILAYASSFSKIQNQLGITNNSIESNHVVLRQLSELPSNTNAQKYAIDSEIFSILSYVSNEKFMSSIGNTPHKIDMEAIFGSENLKVLKAKKVKIKGTKIKGNNNSTYKPKSCLDYPQAIWVAADQSNYSSRNGTSISAVTIHTIQGYYASCISYFQGSSANVSAHYVIRSSDGQVTQMVCEDDKGWHVGTENSYTIGIEHEGFVSDSSWYTNAMYESSADLVRDIANSGYGIDPLRTAFWPWTSTTLYNQAGIPGLCAKIKGHMHFPNQTHTDPGQYWNWDKYYKLINNNASQTILNDSSGTFYDSGNATGDYSNDERTITVIKPINAEQITLEFTDFNIEQDWDFMYIYDGDDVWAPLIGHYTGANNPGIITSSGNSLTIEFRSDCATTTNGWEASWSSCSRPIAGVSIRDSGLTILCIDSSRTTGNNSHIWDFGNGYFSTIQNPSYTYLDEGDYTICHTVYDSCGADSICETITLTNIAANWEMLAYPNPFENTLYIDGFWAPNTNTNIKIIDSKGSMIYNTSSYEQNIVPKRLTKQIDTKNLTKGIYFLEVTTPLAIKQFKLLKL
jgi:PKD repeat protein/N-acetyl-anhydromuramyl-L-alanine amidase AmpD